MTNKQLIQKKKKKERNNTKRQKTEHGNKINLVCLISEKQEFQKRRKGRQKVGMMNGIV